MASQPGQPVSDRLRRALVLTSMALYLIALALPVGKTYGISVLLLDGPGAVTATFQLIALEAQQFVAGEKVDWGMLLLAVALSAWWANVVYWIGLLQWFRERRRAASILGMMAAALALSYPVVGFIFSGGETLEPAGHCVWAVVPCCVWVLSMAVLGLAAPVQAFKGRTVPAG